MEVCRASSKNISELQQESFLQMSKLQKESEEEAMESIRYTSAHNQQDLQVQLTQLSQLLSTIIAQNLPAARPSHQPEWWGFQVQSLLSSGFQVLSLLSSHSPSQHFRPCWNKLCMGPNTSILGRLSATCPSAIRTRKNKVWASISGHWPPLIKERPAAH